MPQKIVQYLQDLIRCKSITPNSSGCIEYISNLLKDHGFSVEIKTFGDSAYQVTNLYAVYGNSRPNICFAGHIDVVPPGNTELWDSDPFTPTIKGDRLYGRGAVDMKGAVAASLAAAIDFIKKHGKLSTGSISFLITSDEEGEAIYGTAAMLEYLKQTNREIDFVILGEPTSEKVVGDTVKIGRRGSVNFALTIDGKQGHVAYPHHAINPVHILVKIMDELTRYVFDTNKQSKDATTLQITSIDVGNNVNNIVPGKATAKFNVRFNSGHTGASIADTIKQIVNKYHTDYLFNYTISANAFIQKQTKYIQQFCDVVEDIVGIKPQFSTSGGTSDARFIKDYCQVVEFGLLFKTAHQVNEYTEISNLQRLYSVYYGCLCKFLI